MAYIDVVSKMLLNIVKANIIVLIIILLSAIIERLFGVILFIKYFKWKKSPNNADIAADAHSGYYLVIMVIFYLYEIVKGNIEFKVTVTILWFVICIILIIIFHKFYNKYQGIDANRNDDDFTYN